MAMAKWLRGKVAFSRISLYGGVGLVVAAITVAVIAIPQVPSDVKPSERWQAVAQCYAARQGIVAPAVLYTSQLESHQAGRYQPFEHVILLDPDSVTDHGKHPHDQSYSRLVVAEELAHAYVENRHSLLTTLLRGATGEYHDERFHDAHEESVEIVKRCQRELQRSLPASLPLPAASTS